MGAVCGGRDNTKLFVRGNPLMNSLMWDPVELCELFGLSQNGLTENEEPLGRGTPWAPRTMQRSNWIRKIGTRWTVDDWLVPNASCAG